MLTAVENHDLLGLDPVTIEDPYGFMELARAKGPVWQEPHRGVFIVSGYDEVTAIARAPQIFSSAIAIGGPFAGLKHEGDGTVRDTIRAYREGLAAANGNSIGSAVLTDDPPDHTPYRSLLVKMFTPKRIRELEPTIHETASSLIDRFIGDGRVEIVTQFAQPLAYTTIADLLGMPVEDRIPIMERMMATPGQGTARNGTPENAAEFARNQGARFAEEYFDRYLRERRERPREDQLSQLAQLTFPDGTVPLIHDLVAISMNLFAAGQDSTKETMSGLIRLLARKSELADRLRRDPKLVPQFIEEGLRWISPNKLLFRIATEDTEVAGVAIPAGSVVMLAWMAANRDPHMFEDPGAFDPERRNAIKHVAFGHGIHFCIGNAVARLQLLTGLRLFLSRIESFRLDDDLPPVPVASWLLNGWESLNLRFEAAHRT